MFAALSLLMALSAQAQECVDYAANPKLLESLEANASRGALESAEKECLEKAYATSEVQTVKDKISRVLMVNGYAYDTRYWSKLVQRHLDEVDRSDPDIAYLYAYHIYNTHPERAEEVVAWTEVALERKDAWTGDVFVSRVFGLMKLRTIAATTQWQAAEEASVEASVPLAEIERLRLEVKTFSREWIDFAKVAGRSAEQAQELCMAATANASACGLAE